MEQLFFIFKDGGFDLPDGVADATGYKIPDLLTDDENEYYGVIAERLAKTLNISKVHPVVQINPADNSRAVCYLSEPNYPTKVRIMDVAMTQGIYTAADQLREACVIKDSSDALTFGDSPECDRYKLGVTDYCTTMISRLQNQFKKK